MADINYDHVICPNRCHSFRAIPVNVQDRIAELGAQVAEANLAIKRCVVVLDGVANYGCSLATRHIIEDARSLAGELDELPARTAPTSDQ